MSDIAWTCPSCETVWHAQPLIDGVIGCPSCGNVAAADLRARLSAAEQERDKALQQLHYVPDDWRYAGRLRAAEARAEAAEQALRKIAWSIEPQRAGNLRAIARAALAGRQETT